MTWWGSAMNGDSFSPKQKSRFIVEMGNGGNLFSVKSARKPVATVESKQYKMINHYYNYPGLVKWEPITITFVDTKVWGDSTAFNTAMFDRNVQSARDEHELDNPSRTERGFLEVRREAFARDLAGLEGRFETNPGAFQRSTSQSLWEMLVAAGYTPPSLASGGISSPEKASTVANAFGSLLRIHQLHPDGFKKNVNGSYADGRIINSTETWELHNPIITKISWGELSYDDDGLVEYTLDIAYDWATHTSTNPV